MNCSIKYPLILGYRKLKICQHKEKANTMVWGSFGPVHIISLFAGVGIIVALYFAIYKLPQKWQIVILGILSFSGIIGNIYNLVAWNSPIEYLPFHLCSINAIILPIAVLTKNKILGNLLLFWSVGAVFALILNTYVADAVLFSPAFNIYYFPHVLEVGIPILLFKLGIIKKDFKCIPYTIGITLGIFIVVHFINLAINSYCVANNVTDYAGNVIKVNYMFTMFHDNIPLLSTFYQILPVPFWYMLFVLPIIAIYLVIVYLPQIIGHFKLKSK